MTPYATSRDQRGNSPAAAGLTLTSVLAAIAAADLPATRQRDMASAVRVIARLLGTPPEVLPAEPRLLARRLDRITPAAHGMSPARWANIRSLLRAGLDLLGPIAPGRHLNELSPDWKALWDALEARSLKIGLSRFMRFCSAAGVEPDALTPDIFDRFAADLRQSLLQDPEGALRCARSAWGRARVALPDWPAVAWPRPPRRGDHFSFPWSTFPESLRSDVAAWIVHLRGDDLLSTTHRPLRPTSLTNREGRARGFASALVHRGRDPATLRSLADLVEVAAVHEGLRFYLERNGKRRAPGVAEIASILLAVARHHVKAPEAQIAELKKLAARVQPERAHGMVERNRSRLRPFDNPETVSRLLHLPGGLLAEAEAMPKGPRAAVRVQTALAVEILLVAPIRISNLAAIDLDRHLVRPGRGRDLVVLTFTREEVKNGQVLDYPLPASTVVLLNRYLSDYRPLLAPAGSTALFPGEDGRPKGRAVLGPRISRTIFERTGLEVHPHLFRHIAAKLQLEAEPGSYELVRRLLGHTSVETTTRAYAGTETAAAVRHYDRVVERLRSREAPR